MSKNKASWPHSFVISHHHLSSTLIFLSQNHRSLTLVVVGLPICIISLWNNLPVSFRQPNSSSVTIITQSNPSLPLSSIPDLKHLPQILPTNPPQILSYPPDCPHALRTAQRFVLVLPLWYLSSFSSRVCRTKLAFTKFLSHTKIKTSIHPVYRQTYAN